MGKVTLKDDYVRDGITLYVNDQKIIYTDHDETGWAGVELLRNTGEELARILGFEFEETSSDEDDE